MHVINLVKKTQTLHYHRSVLLMQPSPTDKATLAADPKNLSVQDTNSVQEVPLSKRYLCDSRSYVPGTKTPLT